MRPCFLPNRMEDRPKEVTALTDNRFLFINLKHYSGLPLKSEIYFWSTNSFAFKHIITAETRHALALFSVNHFFKIVLEFWPKQITRSSCV